MSIAWHVTVFARQDRIKKLDDYLRPDRGRIDFDDNDAVAAALDRLVAAHASRDGLNQVRD